MDKVKVIIAGPRGEWEVKPSSSLIEQRTMS